MGKNHRISYEKRNFLSHVIRRLILAWLVGALVEFLLLPNKETGITGTGAFGLMSPVRVWMITGTVFMALMVLARFFYTERWECWGIFFLFLMMVLVAIKASFRGSFFGACILCLVILFVYASKGWDQTQCIPYGEIKKTKGAKFIVILLALLFFDFVTLWTVARVYSFCAPSYDFGIFSQMFYYMKETGLPLTTLERDGLLSHFAVHVSPIYYLLLPFYLLAPYPMTLQILQAAVITSAVIPLWKLGDHYRLSDRQKVLLCGILLLLPAFAGGVGYDIHENCFLTPLLLWLFYGIEKRKTWLILITTFLTLCVKEDAAVYVGVVALWLFFRACLNGEKGNRKELIIAFCLIGISALWFLGVTTYLKHGGDGVMTDRYKNVMEQKGGSLLEVVCNIFLHPMKVLYECSDPEKLRYLALTMVPLLGLPLLTRRYERYILLIPYILVNLLSDYEYQHHIFFQYSFGSTAFLIYLTLVNLGDFKESKKKTVVLSATVMLCSVFFAMIVVPKAMTYPTRWMKDGESIGQIRRMLSIIPEDATVTASAFYTVELSQRKDLYDISYASEEHLLDSEYIVLDPSNVYHYNRYHSTGKLNGLENLLALLEKEGYEEIASIEDRLYIYKRTGVH